MYDYVIVGAGSAGCLLANRLCADPAHRVLVLEAGGKAQRREASIPAAWVKLFKTECDWGYETEPIPGLDGRRLYFPRGKMLGGTSGMNAMVYSRGNAADYDEWAAAGNPGWSYAEVLPYFRRSESNSRGASEFHGADGPLPVSDLSEHHPISEAFAEAAQSIGIPFNPDFNGIRQDGVGFVQFTVRRGRRCSAADAFLHPAMRRPNLTVLTGAQATRIVFEGARAVGVEYVRDGQVGVARAEREVIVSAGAVDSPKLLLLSGLGPADELKLLGIDPVLDLPGVGRNLQDHPGGLLLMRCSRPISLLTAESPRNLLRYLLFRRGVLASPGAETAAFVRSRQELEAPNLELVLFPVLWLDEGLTQPTEHGYTVAVILLRPKSRGQVSLRSADPLAPPVIDSNHFSDPAGDDLRDVVAGLRLARKIVSAPPLASLGNGEIFPGESASGDAELAASARAAGQTIWHPVGTCRMGTDETSVVDPELRVRGVEGLRVIDASVMPVIVRGHTHAPTVMIAERGADLLLGAARTPVAVARTQAAAPAD